MANVRGRPRPSQQQHAAEEIYINAKAFLSDHVRGCLETRLGVLVALFIHPLR